MYESSLQFVDLVKSDGRYIPGLVPMHGQDTTGLSIDEQAAVFDARSFNHIDFVFFRRFSDGRSSHVSAFVVNNSDKRLDEKALAELHHQVWLQGTVPLLYVAWPSRLDILTCARGPDFWKVTDGESHYSPAKTFEEKAFQTAGAINRELQRFSVFRLADGTFWEEPANRLLADHAKAAHKSLIQAVVETDNDLDGKNNPSLRRLLLLMVLIKYLEDRRVFPGEGWFGRFRKGAQSFFEVLRGGNPEEVYRLLDFLERKFNGDVFALPRDGRHRLTKEILRRFADLVEARTIKQQRYLWQQFSFEHIPVEIISHLYQRFVQGGHGAVYTPPFLASLLLDQAMPYGNLTGTERILDPACGSGVFLVAAFRRLVNVWRSRNGWRRPDVETLKGILGRSIYGIEIDPNAVHLAEFSLCLAICDALQPDVIWRELQFAPLRNSNLFEGDFFRALLDSQQGKGKDLNKDFTFDVVVGNPPFESELSASGTEVDNDAQQRDNNRGALPDNQAAYLFLEQALNVISPSGRVCLIQPHGFLYNSKAQEFRATIYRKHKVGVVFDFTSIRKLYEADPKTIAVLAYPEPPPESHSIDHWTFRRTVSVQERICFELDHYDYHSVSQKEAETSASFVWRTNLLGGGRLSGISQRLRNMRTLEQYVKKQTGWDYGEGFIAGTTGRRTPAPFLTGMDYLPTNAFTGNGIDETRIDTVNETEFRSPYTETRYSSPLVLIKTNDSLPVVFWDEGDERFIAFRAKILSIHAPRPQVAKLRKLYDTICHNHDLYRFACALSGTQALIGKATSVLKQDIDMLPYPENKNELSLSFWEKVLCEDVLEHMNEYVRLGQNSSLLKKAATVDDLREYSSMFTRMLGSVYDNLKPCDAIFFNGLVCQPFYFGERPNLSWLTGQTEQEMRNLIYDDRKHKHLRTIRVLKFYSENVLLLVKPDRLRYWIRSTAIRDADETLMDLRRQGY